MHARGGQDVIELTKRLVGDEFMGEVESNRAGEVRQLIHDLRAGHHGELRGGSFLFDPVGHDSVPSGQNGVALLKIIYSTQSGRLSHSFSAEKKLAYEEPGLCSVLPGRFHGI